MSELGYLQLHTAQGIGAATMRRVLARLDETETSLDDFLRLSSGEQVEDFGLAPRQAEALGAARAEAERIRADLQQRGVSLLTKASPEYPSRLRQRLGDSAPPILYVWGNLRLFRKQAVGFCGARDVSDQGLEVARDCASQLADWGWTVVSGGARGVDAATHHAALEAGGSTIIVLPAGILSHNLRRALKRLVTKQRTLIISEFAPTAPWSVANAMERNRTICGLSAALVVIESGTSGGTFAAGQLALRLNTPLFVADYAEPTASAAGNAYFLGRGAYPLRRSTESGQANLEPVRLTVESGQEKTPKVVQERLL